MKVMGLAAATAILTATPIFAQSADPRIASPDELHVIADESGVCEDRDVRSAVFNLASNVIEVECEEEAVGFVPLVGGLGSGGAAAIAGGLAAVAVVAASDTQ